MAKVTITFTEDEVRKIKELGAQTLAGLPPSASGQTVELCGNEPAYLEMGIIDDEDFPGECDLFVTVLHNSGQMEDQWEQHFLNSFVLEFLEPNVEYSIFTGGEVSVA